MGRVIRPYDREELRTRFRSAKPFPWVEIPEFLESEFLEEVIDAYPKFDEAWQHAESKGRAFKALHERFKVQVTDAEQFPGPVRRLHDALASSEFLSDLEYITGIPKLLADAEMVGAGMHMTGPGGRLDVHVDFNYDERRQFHRRLNILIYLNPDWDPQWRGDIELWDKSVTVCEQSFLPLANRCVLFETSEISFHGVQPLKCPEDVARKSFAAYYYTKEPPAGWDGVSHTTIFKARPSEVFRGRVLKPLSDYRQRVRRRVMETRRFIGQVVRAVVNSRTKS